MIGLRGFTGARRVTAIAGSLLLTVALAGPAVAQDDEAPLIGFANILRTGCAFCVDVEDSINRELPEGWQLFSVDHNVDPVQILANADAMVTQGVDVYLNFDGGITDYQVTYQKMQDAGIPMIFIDGPYPDFEQPDTYWIGAASAEAGRLLGEYAVQYAADNWGGEIDGIFATFQSNWPPETQARLIEAMNVIAETYPEYAFEGTDFQNITVNDVVLDPEPTLAGASAWLNANPGKDKLLFIATTNDVHGLAEESALDSLGRTGDGVILSMGADSSAQEAIRAGGDFKMSVAFGPEKYGEKLIPLVEQILAGETPPDITPADAFIVDLSNIEEHYPE
jgi:ribose transport system substrate-binding protein